jgi:hypothetical protein
MRNIVLMPISSRLIGNQFSSGTQFGLVALTYISMIGLSVLPVFCSFAYAYIHDLDPRELKSVI